MFDVCDVTFLCAGALEAHNAAVHAQRRRTLPVPNPYFVGAHSPDDSEEDSDFEPSSSDEDVPGGAYLRPCAEIQMDSIRTGCV